jgi:small subunit ribosomal protein S21
MQGAHRVDLGITDAEFQAVFDGRRGFGHGSGPSRQEAMGRIVPAGPARVKYPAAKGACRVLRRKQSREKRLQGSPVPHTFARLGQGGNLAFPGREGSVSLSTGPPAGAPQERNRVSRMIKVKARSNESVQQMIRRFKKMCEKEGLTKDVKRNSYYEKPSVRRRRQERKSLKRILSGGE